MLTSLARTDFVYWHFKLHRSAYNCKNSRNVTHNPTTLAFKLALELQTALYIWRLLDFYGPKNNNHLWQFYRLRNNWSEVSTNKCFWLGDDNLTEMLSINWHWTGYFNLIKRLNLRFKAFRLTYSNIVPWKQVSLSGFLVAQRESLVKEKPDCDLPKHFKGRMVFPLPNYSRTACSLVFASASKEAVDEPNAFCIKS